MCGIFTFNPTSTFYDRYSLSNKLPSLKPVPRATPGQFLPVIYRDQTNIIDVMRWGLIPQWAKNTDFGSKLFNARSETILEKPSFRGSFNSCRCLVPVSGFFENRRYLTLADNPVFSLAGLYSVWESPDGSILPTFTIITTQANELISPYHDRMPVILDRGDEVDWLDPTTPSSHLVSFFKPFSAARLLLT